MTFTVVWSTDAERVLTRLWTDASDRRAVADAANAMDVLLRTAPLEVGESRAADDRILTVLPLSVHYDVRTDDRLVEVWAVWRVREQ
jgi:hypothetical protein